MMEIILPLLSSLFHAFATTFDKKAIEFNEPDNFLLFSLIIIPILMLPFSPLFFQVTQWGAFIVLLLIIVVVDGSANLLYNRTLKKEEAGFCLPLISISPFFTILLSFIFAPGEIVTLTSMAALIAIISSVYVLNVKENLIQSFTRLTQKRNILLLIAAVMYGFTAIIIKYALNYTNPLTLYMLRITFMIPFVFILMKGKPQIPQKINIMLVAQSLYIATHVTYYLAISQYNLLISTTLSHLAPLFLLITAYILLKEKITWQKITASTIIVGGILILSILR